MTGARLSLDGSGFGNLRNHCEQWCLPNLTQGWQLNIQQKLRALAPSTPCTCSSVLRPWFYCSLELFNSPFVHLWLSGDNEADRSLLVPGSKYDNGGLGAVLSSGPFQPDL